MELKPLFMNSTILLRRKLLWLLFLGGLCCCWRRRNDGVCDVSSTTSLIICEAFTTALTTTSSTRSNQLVDTIISTTTLLFLSSSADSIDASTVDFKTIEPASLTTTGITDPTTSCLSKGKEGDHEVQKQTSRDISSDNETIMFPPPLSPFERLKRAATFWSTVFPIFLSYQGLMMRLSLFDNTFSSDSQTVEEMWEEQHTKSAKQLANVITHLKGFYVKSAQIISTRVDLFPKQYCIALQGFTDSLDPMPVELVKAVIQRELCNEFDNNLTFEDVFEEFDNEPLGSASVAQVHRAVLTPKYSNGRKGNVVAVKVQRPSIESKLMGDIANLKTVAKTFEGVLPLDYYKVFSELEMQLADEFDFVSEADAMDIIYNNLHKSPLTGEYRDVPVVIPRPIHRLVTRRLLVMDYLDGIPLSRVANEQRMGEKKSNNNPSSSSPQVKLFGRQLLSALTQSFGRSILETGFFHADPHPGNVMILNDGRIGLIDFGQHKQISKKNRETLSKVMIGLDERGGEQKQFGEGMPISPEDLEIVGTLSLELGVKLKPGTPKIAAAAIGQWLFDDTEGQQKLVGGYDRGEFAPNSPVRALQSFPQDLVLVGRSTILIKGISSRLGIPWSLAKEWAPIAREVLRVSEEEGTAKEASSLGSLNDGRVPGRLLLLRKVWKSVQQWAMRNLTRLVKRLPSFLQTWLASIVLKFQDSRRRRNKAKTMMK